MNRGRILTLALSLSLVALLAAQRSEALTISPPTFEVMAKPGESKSLSIRVINDQSTLVTLFTSTANFKAQGETGQPDFLFDVETIDLASWIKPGKTSFTLEPGDSTFVPFTIDVPAQAEPGGHYAGLFFGTGAPAADGGQVGIESKLGALIILSVEGNIRESAAVKEFDTSPDRRNHLPVPFVLRIENIGNVHFRPAGFVTIRNMFGGVSTTIPVNPKEGAVLPASIRRFDLLWQRLDSQDNGGSFFRELADEWKNFGLGSYTAEAVVTYGQNDRVITATTKFTVFPWRLFLLIAVIVVVLIWLLVKGIKSYNAMIVRRAEAGGPRPPGRGAKPTA
ncbi:MAG: hypothetical protein HY567_03785 [Candidatus Kerfeldbacteria bacterium]|nr:hypothetical protein [Candidatus Kerfeldbacteria bacterium]